MTTFQGAPLTDLPRDSAALSSGQLATLAEVWSEQREHLERQDSIQDFLRRLKRRWAIETGVIEDLYTLDRGITEILIQRGIEAALIPSESTQYKRGPNNPTRPGGEVHEYCPPEQVGSEMDNLITLPRAREGECSPGGRGRVAPPPVHPDPSVHGWERTRGPLPRLAGALEGRMVPARRDPG